MHPELVLAKSASLFPGQTPHPIGSFSRFVLDVSPDVCQPQVAHGDISEDRRRCHVRRSRVYTAMRQKHRLFDLPMHECVLANDRVS